jgi:hypothetical protein
MRRFNFFIDQKLIEKLNRNKEKYGFNTVAAFIRFIIIKFFSK